MHFTNLATYEKRPSYDYTKGDILGTIVKTEEEVGDGRVGVGITKFLYNKDLSTAFENEESVDFKLLNDSDDDFFDKNITVTNHVLLEPMTLSNIGKPNYQKGETVFVKMIDSDIKSLSLYPYSINGQESSRGKHGDSVTFFVPALNPTSQSNTPITKENSYFLDMDSRKERQLISLGTTNKNGEPFPLNFTMDGKNGVISMSSDSKLVFSYNPNEDKMLFYTDGQASIEVKEDTATIVAKKILIKGESEVKIDTKKFIVNSNETDITSKIGKFEIDQFKQTSNSITLKSQTTTIDGLSTNIKALTGVMVESPASVFNGVIGAASMTFGAMPPTPSGLPPVSKNTMDVPAGKVEIGAGQLNIKSGSLKINSGVPLAKSPQLKSILKVMAALIDSAAISPNVSVGATATISGLVETIGTVSVTGS